MILRPSRLITIFLTFLCSLYELSGQVVNNVVTPSPSAAEIGRFGAVPVGLFTGSMQNQVPIYEMGNANLKIPVSLQYSSNGFNVDKTASTVGYDWSLDAGGVINHYINGRYDSYTSNVRDYNTLSNKTDHQKWLFLNEFNPVDIFTFTLPGLSGSFYLDNNGKPVIIKKGDNLNISVSGLGSKQFTIKAPDGTQYIFADFVSQDNQGFECWYLSSIEHPSGDHIDFTYSAAKSYLLDVLEREVDYPIYDYLNKLPTYNKESIIFRNAADRYLERIDFSGVGSMVFTNSYNRSDSKSDPKVDEITVLDAQGNTIRKVKLSYTFAQSNALYDNKDLSGVFNYPSGYLYHKYRMFLNKVEFNDKNDSKVYSYAFQYNDLNNLPCRNSYAKDLWGYFNGKANTDLFKTYDYNWLVTNFSLTVYSQFENLLRLGKSPNSCDRSADFTFSQKGMLSRITYPTGGYTNINYEAHKNEANEQVGGCRVARVETFSSNSNPEIKVYKYPQVVTNYNDMNYNSNPGYVLHSFMYTENCETSMAPQTKTAYYVKLSPGIQANFSTGGYHLSYSKIEILHGANGENGSEEHEFRAVPQQNPFPIKRAQVYTPFKRFNTDLFNGTPTRIAYKKNNQVQKEIIYNYDFSNTKYQESLVCNSVYYNENSLKYVTPAQSGGIYMCLDFVEEQRLPFYDISLYVLYSNFPYLKSKKESVVDDNANTITTETFYDYCEAPYTNVRSVTVKNSKGKDIVSTYKYPFDNQTQNPYGGMVTNKVTSPVIETQEYVIENGQSLLKSTVSADYSEIKPGLYLPSAIYKLESPSLLSSGNYTTYANGLITRGSNFGLSKQLEYDTKGNIIKVVSTNGIITSYLWGYNKSYPVAELINADWTTASTYIDQSILNNPPDDATLRSHLNNLRNIPGALITTYTYKPLVGMTSSTDANGRTTYYEYDGFGRLAYIRDKDNNLLKKICYNYTGQPETCPNGFGNAVKSGTFTKNNCSADYGTTVTYTVPANTYFGTTQADADALAQNDINTNGQTYANVNGTCVSIFYCVAKSGTFTKNNCPSGQTGSSVTYTVPANTYTSTISEADADSKAQNDVNTNGQTYANNNGTCGWYNVAKSGIFTKNDCESGGTGFNITYAVPPGTYSSTISQADADQKAQNDVNTNGQAFANSHSVCLYYNVAKSGTFTKNNCPGGQTGSSVTYTIPAKSYGSIISQADADSKAQNEVNTYGQTYANNNGTCAWYNVAKSGTFQRNNCPSGYTASNVTYTVAAGTYSSTISQADADQKAQNDVNTNAQNYANNNGTCGGPCTITINSGYKDLAHGINSNGTTVSFGFALYSYSTMYPGTPYVIGTIYGDCVPSAQRTVYFTWSGRSCSIVISTNGQMTLSISTGTPVNPNTVIGTQTLIYNL